MLSQNSKSTDSYLRPVFSNANKLRRLLWQISWLLLCRWTPAPLHKWRCLIVKLFGGKLGASNSIYPDCKIWAPWLLETEEVVTIGPKAEVYNPGGIYIGHHSILSQNAFVCGATHDYNTKEFTYLMRKIVLEPYVWLCAHSILLPGVHCGEGSVLGAGAVAVKDLAPWTVYSGNPAKAIKQRVNFLKPGS